MTERRDFPRSFDSLRAIVAFAGEFFARHGVDARLRPAVELALEELFTNMVKYGADGHAQVGIAMTALAEGVEVTLTDSGAPAFDVTGAPDADVTLPIEERRPGGLGLHLVRRLLDSLAYTYVQERRESRITFRKTLAGAAASATPAQDAGTGARE
jgi:anti-sigma regulatory factor (Ser/Thr protein kinase)